MSPVVSSMWGLVRARRPASAVPFLNLITLMQGSGYSATSLAIFNLSGGIVTAKGLQIGSANTFGNNPNGSGVNITGGALYLDAPANITRPGNPGTKFGLNISGGTIGATANWSPACTVPIESDQQPGDITFQSADANGSRLIFPCPCADRCWWLEENWRGRAGLEWCQ